MSLLDYARERSAGLSVMLAVLGLGLLGGAIVIGLLLGPGTTGFVPFALRSALRADYSADPRSLAQRPPLHIGILQEFENDQASVVSDGGTPVGNGGTAGPGAPSQSLITLLFTPVPVVTYPPGQQPPTERPTATPVPSDTATPEPTATATHTLAATSTAVDTEEPTPTPKGEASPTRTRRPTSTLVSAGALPTPTETATRPVVLPTATNTEPVFIPPTLPPVLPTDTPVPPTDTPPPPPPTATPGGYEPPPPEPTSTPGNGYP
jgi:hypothetical protein